MPIRRELKAFWWFVEGRVGGMGRPGYNQCHWSDLSLEEGLIFSWLGKQHQTSSKLESLWAYLDVYGPKVAPFYSLSRTEVHGRLRSLRDRDTLLTVVQSMNAKAGILQEVTWQDSGTHTMLHFPPNVPRLHHEVALLKHYNVSVVVSLLEQPLDQTALEAYFEVYHLPVEDVTPPSYEQVYAFADILYTTLAAGKNVVTHCLAGVGRTTTMLLAAALVQGHTWEELVTWVQTCNPHFQFKGCQVAFLQALAQDITNGRRPLRSAAQEMYRCQ
jgi:hypothetical protein